MKPEAKYDLFEQNRNLTIKISCLDIVQLSDQMHLTTERRKLVYINSYNVCLFIVECLTFNSRGFDTWTQLLFLINT